MKLPPNFQPKSLRSSRLAAWALAVVAVAAAACDGPRKSAVSPPPLPGQSTPFNPSIHREPGRDLKQRQIAFLNHIRESDPQQRIIDRAMLNEDNELGLILDRSVEMEKIPALMRSMLTQMAKEFPGENLTIIAYTPSAPPRKIGTARLDARSRDMTYTPAS